MKTVKIFLELVFVSAVFASCSSEDGECYDFAPDSEVQTSSEALENENPNG